MLAAFYHDIGKTIVSRRHGMEGAILLANHATSACYKLNLILQKYRSLSSDNQSIGDLQREDFMLVADFVHYHDLFGTLATGETGYVRLVDVIDRLKRYSFKELGGSFFPVSDEDRDKQKLASARLVFDLWLLNVADILVSRVGVTGIQKWHNQVEALWANPHEAVEKIRSYLGDPDAARLWHDLDVALKLLAIHNRQLHSGDTEVLQQEAVKFSSRHSIERIRRVAKSSIDNFIEGTCKNYGGADKRWNSEFEHVEPILKCVSELSEEEWHSIIERCIKSGSDFVDLSRRLAWVGQLDYALGFFSRIADFAMREINSEIRFDQQGRTRWIYSAMTDASAMTDVKEREKLKPKEELQKEIYNAVEKLVRINARFFADNFAAISIQIIEQILFREPELNRARNFEFADATSRLTDDKLRRMLGMEGPFRSRRGIHLILQTIFIW
jgi:hypothetical protein